MKVSVIIPVYNEEKHIKECLLSLSKQTLKDFEIIVVDDGSVDNTLKVVDLIRTDYFDNNFKILQQRHLGPATARNKGAKTSTGEILVFVDADMTFTKNFLKELTLPIRTGKALGTYSEEEYVGNWENVWARCWNYNEGISNKKRHKTSRRYFYQRVYDFTAFVISSKTISQKLFKEKQAKEKTSIFRAIKRSEFLKVGGYDSGGYTDDYSLGRKLKTKAVRVSNGRFFHNNPDSLVDTFRQAKWVAKRNYKLGIIGDAYIIFKSFLPISLVIGISKAILYKEPRFIIFKIVYDIAIIIGIMEFRLKRKGSK